MSGAGKVPARSLLLTRLAGDLAALRDRREWQRIAEERRALAAWHRQMSAAGHRTWMVSQDILDQIPVARPDTAGVAPLFSRITVKSSSVLPPDTVYEIDEHAWQAEMLEALDPDRWAPLWSDVDVLSGSPWCGLDRDFQPTAPTLPPGATHREG